MLEFVWGTAYRTSGYAMIMDGLVLAWIFLRREKREGFWGIVTWEECVMNEWGCGWVVGRKDGVMADRKRGKWRTHWTGG